MKEKSNKGLNFKLNNTADDPLSFLLSKNSSKVTPSQEKIKESNNKVIENVSVPQKISVPEKNITVTSEKEYNVNRSTSQLNPPINVCGDLFSDVGNNSKIPTDEANTIMSEDSSAQRIPKLNTSSLSYMAQSVLGHARDFQSFARQAATSILSREDNDKHPFSYQNVVIDQSGDDERSNDYKQPLYGKLQNAWITELDKSQINPSWSLTIKCNYCSHVYTLIDDEHICYILPDQYLSIKQTQDSQEVTSKRQSRLENKSTDVFSDIKDDGSNRYNYEPGTYKPFQLLPNESVLMVETNALFSCFTKPHFTANLLLTQYRLVLQVNVGSNSTPILLGTQWLHFLNYYIIPYGVINSIAQKQIIESNSEISRGNSVQKSFDLKHKTVLMIETKDNRSIKLYLKNNNVYRFLNYQINEITLKEMFAFHNHVDYPEKFDYDFKKELDRFIDIHPEFLRLSEINNNYILAPTYPKIFIVPNVITDEQLHKIAEFRFKKRFPILSWGGKKHYGTLWRSSQPKSMFNRCFEDEFMLSLIANYRNGNKEKSFVLIIDARPYINAIANKASGGGFENTENNYSFCRIEFGNIQNIHSVYDSWQQMNNAVKKYFPILCRTSLLSYTTNIQNIDFPKSNKDPTKFCPNCEHQMFENAEPFLCASSKYPFYCFYPTGSSLSSKASQTYSQYLHSIAQSQWYNSIQLVLKISTLAVSQLEHGQSVLVHCSDGWDRTSQVTALAMLCIDPYYRTLRGFMVLLQQEFLNAGHPFHSRSKHPGQPCSQICKDSQEDEELQKSEHVFSSKQFSPVFTQWLDCVYQLMRQFPNAFEFTTIFLDVLVTEIYNCYYGNFLLNNMMEREAYQVSSKCNSIFDAITSYRYKFIHKNYNPHIDATLYPEISMVQVWESYWFRYMPQGLSIFTKVFI